MILVGKHVIVPGGTSRGPLGANAGYLEIDYYGTWYDAKGAKQEADVQKELWDLAKQLIVWND